MNGTIQKVIAEKGFGFITAADGKEYFFHSSAVSGASFDSLSSGQAVTFDIGQGPKGPRAENVKVGR